jgi:transcriptional regulator with XRE-family HTH domain
MSRKKWSEIKASNSATVRENAFWKTQRIVAALQLDELRRLVGVTQDELAERLGTNQPNISKLERREDMHISSLRDVVAALGGSLEINARFPGYSVPLRQFSSASMDATTGALTHGEELRLSVPNSPAYSERRRRVGFYWAGFGSVVGTLPREQVQELGLGEVIDPNAPFDNTETGQAA